MLCMMVLLWNLEFFLCFDCLFGYSDAYDAILECAIKFKLKIQINEKRKQMQKNTDFIKDIPTSVDTNMSS